MPRHITPLSVVLSLFISLLCPAVACLAVTAQEKGLSIAVEMQRRDQGWGEQRVSMQMVLRNRQGQRSEPFSLADAQ